MDKDNNMILYFCLGLLLVSAVWVALPLLAFIDHLKFIKKIQKRRGNNRVEIFK
jgi:hypothetical protein